LQGMPRRTYTYPDGMGWNLMNMIETIGSVVIAVSVLVFLINAVVTRKRGEIATADPWDGRTLEWSIPSPPPEYNFVEVPLVKERDDWWHRKYAPTPEGEPVRVFAGGADIHEDDEDAGHGIHLPSPSYFPLVAAAGLPVMGWGVVYAAWPVVIAGGLVTLLGVFGWAFEPPAEEEH
ncbi:MAG: cytochrome c oxidase subunit 4, partial [Actinomycetota bacterium]|nr:cytochrome c oxidase subunit 4 [Actinomycetota bacterium]